MARIVQFEGRAIRVPDDATDVEVAGIIEQATGGKVGASDTAKDESGIMQSIAQGAGNLAAGAVRGAGSIGSTILYPWDKANDLIRGDREGQSSRNEERRQGIDEGLRSMGADPDSIAYAAGKLGGEIAGTAGVGGVMAKGLSAIPALAKFAPAVQSGGFNLGGAATGNRVADAAIRAAGGAAQGGAQAAMVDPSQAGTGAMIGAVAPGAVKVTGAAGGWVRDKGEAMSRKLMASALKPTVAQWRTGQAGRAIDTMLDEGVNATRSGVDKLKTRIGDLNDEIASMVHGSNATVDRNKVIAAVSDARSKFINQVDPASDLAAIDDVVGGFKSHPYFQQIEAQGKQLQEALDIAVQGKEQALQAAWKFKTFAAQQGKLAEGDVLDLATKQPQNQPYFNVGRLGGTAKSPQAYPVSGQPRFPARYTSNADRVAEGEGAYQDAMAAYLARRSDEEAARQTFAKWKEASGSLPVEMAQQLKQGTYRTLKGKYGEVGSAATEAQKALARGLKEGVADAVPGVVPLNARESALLDALSVAERRAMMDTNKNPLGLAAISPSPAGLAAFLADRSDALKSVAARGIHRTANAIPQGMPGFVDDYGLLGVPSVAVISSP